jgi:hypothetical protein
MSNFPNNFDDDTTLPFVNDNITEIGGDAINALRDAALALEQNVGLGAHGTTASIAVRLGVSLNPDGTLKPSAITGLGLVTLPITNDQIADWAQIPERKLALDHKTQDLFNYIRDLSSDVNLALGWVSTQGIKLEPHLMGALYRHSMHQIDVTSNLNELLINNLRAFRNNDTSYLLVKDMNDELLAHQWADGSAFGTLHNIVTNNGSSYQSYYAHPASGISLNVSRFNNVLQSANNVQLFAEFIDQSSIFVLGTRIQNLYTSGISRISRSSVIDPAFDGYGQHIIPPTPAIAYLKNIGNSGSPYDDIDAGDDIIEFKPAVGEQTTNNFDAKFALVKAGDIVRINYGPLEVPFLIKEKKYSGTSGAKKYVIRIAGKNHLYAPNAIARIDKPLANNNKYGELSISPVNNLFGGTPSLIINNPRGAQATGIGFNPDQFDENHYLLYLALYPTGFAQDGYVILPPIDVTGNQGTTPGLYTLESIVHATNTAFRTAGYNYRFSAFSFGGEFGICLSDSYNNAAFSIINAAMKTDGSIDTLASQVAFPKNVVDVFPADGGLGPDPLGFGSTGANVASPPFYSTYGTPSNPSAAGNPTKLFVALRRNNYYVNGSERERLNRETSQALDGYGDGYWTAEITNVAALAGRVETTYRIFQDLSNSGLKIGKTIVVQSHGGQGTINDFGRFIIKNVVFGCDPVNFTDITVYDSVHGVGASPAPVLDVDGYVNVYFGYDSVSFNAESATDQGAYGNFKRHFEVYVDGNGNTFTHERGRITLNDSGVTVNGVPVRGSSGLKSLNIVRISPKLRGFQFGSVTKTTLRMFNYSSSTGDFDGYLSSYDGTYFTHHGPRIKGRKGEITRFYDETNTDYIDIIFDVNQAIFDFSEQVIDFQLFPSLALDDEIMQIGTCQVDDSTLQVSRIVDTRQFGNTSEKDLSSSVFEYMAAPEKHLHTNGVIRGFDIYQKFNGSSGVIYLTGGVAIVNGKIINMNNDTVSIPPIREFFSNTFWSVNWIVCVTDTGEYKIIPMLDADAANPGTIPPGTARLFQARDVVSVTTYTLPALYFNDLVNARKDITPLYIVKADVAGAELPVTTISTRDARKYVYQKDWANQISLTSETNNGDIRNFESLTTWLNFYSDFVSTVNLKGTYNPPSTFTFNKRIRFYVDGSAFLILSSATTVQNLEFNNIPFNISASSTFNSVACNNLTIDVSSTTLNANTSTFRDCVIDVNASGGLQFTNCTFINCTVNVFSTTGQIFSNCTFNGCTINLQSATFFSVTGVNSVWRNNRINFNAVGNTFSATGLFADNKFTWSVISNNITFSSSTSGVLQVVNNQFVSTNTIPITQFMSITDGTNGVITGNSFYRFTNTVQAYIAAPASWSNGVVVISDNFFDQPTVDGSNQNLISNLPLAWYYRDNLNTPPTVKVRQITSGPYTVNVIDEVIMVNIPSAPITIILPQTTLVPLGRIITIKDISGSFDTYPVTLQRASGETIEGIGADYLYQIPFGSVTLVAISGGWIII